MPRVQRTMCSAFEEQFCTGTSALCIWDSWCRSLPQFGPYFLWEGRSSEKCYHPLSSNYNTILHSQCFMSPQLKQGQMYFVDKQVALATHGYLRAEATTDSFIMEFVSSADGSILDSYKLHKSLQWEKEWSDYWASAGSEL